MLKLYRLPPVSARTMARVAPGMIAPAMTTIQLQVPPDAHPGFMIQASVNGQTIQAQVPPGLQPGATFSVQVPAAPADDPAATAAYDALLAGASRLSFESKSNWDQKTQTGTLAWSVEADTGTTFRVTFDAPSLHGSGRYFGPGREQTGAPYGRGDGSYHAQVAIGDVVVQTLSSTGVVAEDHEYRPLYAAALGCPRPPASQSMDRGEALTIQCERPTECEKYKKCCCCSWPEEYVRLARGGGGGLALVSPLSDEKSRYAVACWLSAITGIPTSCALPACVMICASCCPVEVGRKSYVAYDAAGAPLGGAQYIVPGTKCCKQPKPWLDLGATPVAARRDLVAAAVAMTCTDSAAYVQASY